ncbi:hypothetical protein L7F22_046365 [Adiantum nelumboides]|nr:hypothetical protein [Adiantum nelumboides]
MGDGMDPANGLGPVNNRQHFNKVNEFLADIAANKQKVLVGGEKHTDKGFFVPATIVDNPPDTSKIVIEEPFGPVLPAAQVQGRGRSGSPRQRHAHGSRWHGLGTHRAGAAHRRPSRDGHRLGQPDAELQSALLLWRLEGLGHRRPPRPSGSRAPHAFQDAQAGACAPPVHLL